MIAFIALAMLSGQTSSVPAPVRCETVRVAMPVSLRGWEQVGATPTIGKAFAVSAGNPATIRGLSSSDVTRSGNAALVPFEVPVDATYHVALSDRAWVDVVTGSKIIQSIGHRHGPACSGIVKVVDFPLKRGRYALHITGITTPNVKVLIERA